MKRILALLVPLLLVAACGTDDKADATHNEADIAFAQAMVPHHEQAIEMADLVDDANASAEVTALAAQIKAAQGPEIKQLNEWLAEWDADSGDMAGMDHGSHGSDMTGMMSDDDMKSLADASGVAFDQAWLTMMIAHHEGAVDMAKTQLDEGKSPEATELAKAIIAGQEKEITTMKGLLQ